jgi:hypothetical protein
MLQSEMPRSRNRARIDAVFNGNPPYTDEEATSNSIETNVNFLEGTRIINGARQTFTNAFMKPEQYFTVSLDIGPQNERTKWSKIITREINRIMKRCPKYTATIDSQLAGTVLHGVGPVTWLRDRDWRPRARGIEDVLVPTRTLCSLENLEHFAIYTTFTLSQLVEMTSGDDVDPGWNKPLVAKLVAALKQQRAGNQGESTTEFPNYYLPEKWQEDIKENSGFWQNDAAPIVKCWDFYFFDGDCWYRRIVVDQNSGTIQGVNTANEWLFNPGERNYGKDVTQIMHVQFADGAVVPPFRWHSVRSLGYLLYAVCHLQNRLRSKFMDSTFEQMLWFFRSSNDGDEEAMRKIEMHHLGVIPDGISWVPQAERHVVDRELLSLAMSQNRQLMAESAAQFQADTNDGTQKEMTATEVMARVNSSNQLMGSMLVRGYDYQNVQYREIGRRFCTIDNPDCKRFRQKCEAQGVDPVVWANFDDWDIAAEKVMGSGNKMLEIAQADRLMQIRALLSPEAQAEVVHMFVEANTDNPQLASRLAPIEGQKASPAVERATFAWGTLISGQPIVIATPLNRPEYIKTLIDMLSGEIERVNAAGGMPTQKEVFGMANVVSHCEEQIQQIAEDPGQEQNVKLFTDALTAAGNFIKGYVQRLQEQQQAGNEQVDPEVQKQLIAAQAKADIQRANAEQKREQREIQFNQDQARKDMATIAEAQRQGARVQAEVAAMDVRTAAQIRSKAPTE